MKARLRDLWNKPKTFWQSAALYAGIILFWQIVKAYFPDQTQGFSDTFFVPIVIVLVILVAWGIYRRWQQGFAKPPRRALRGASFDPFPGRFAFGT